MNVNIEDYKRQFYQEAKDLLDQVNDDILKAESEPDNKDLMNSIFRNIHTIKGSAGSFDLFEISEFAHHLEGLLDALREGKIIIDSEIVDVVLEGADYLNKMIAGYESNQPIKPDEELMLRFKNLYNTQNTESKTETIQNRDQENPVENKLIFPDQLSQEFIERLTQLKQDNHNLFQVNVNYNNEVFESGFDPLIFLQNLKENSKAYYVATKTDDFPEISEFEPLKLYLNPTVYIATKLSREEVEDLAFDISLVEVNFIGFEENDDLIDIDKENLNEFLDYADEMLDTYENLLLDYEKNGSKEALNEIFRIIHTIKGDSDYINLKKITLLTHSLEFLLEKLQKGKIKKNTEIIDLILKSGDYLQTTLKKIKQGNRTIELPVFFDKLKQYEKIEQTESLLPDKSEEETKAFIEQAEQYKSVLSRYIEKKSITNDELKIISRTIISLENASQYIGLKTITNYIEEAKKFIDSNDEAKIIESLKKIISFIEGLHQDSKRFGEILIEEGKINTNDLDEALSHQKPIGKILIESGKITEDDVQQALKKQEIMETARHLKPTLQKEMETRTMRVDEKKIENFSNMIGELLIARNTYDYLLLELNKQADQSETLKNLKENLHLFSRITNDLHHGVMSLRMIPIKGIFHKFNRVVRDISRKQKKMISLITEGEDTEIDKKVADMLSEPLVHIVRNSCDHGIETPQERKKAEKPEKASIILRAFQEGSDLIIKIIDDGRGLDRKKLFKKAREMDLNIDSIDDDRLLDVIFMPGLSTKQEVTDLSGRGVGMDVVRTAVNKLGGNVEVISEEGQGTEITLKLPVALGLNVTLLVESNKNIFAIPLDFVLETIKIDPTCVRRHRDNLFFYNRGEVIGVRYLDNIMSQNTNTTVLDELISQSSEISIVILKTSVGKVGIIVDNLIKNMELAIKPVPKIFAEIKVVSGISILGDGKVVLILNPEEF